MVIAREFAEIWLLDLEGDVRNNPKLSGTKRNVFGIQTGVAVALCVKKKGKGYAVIHYARRPETETKNEKLAYLAATGSIRSVNCETVQPDRQYHWLGQIQNDRSECLSIIGSTTGAVARRGHDQSFFALATNGVETKSDEWVYDLTREGLLSSDAKCNTPRRFDMGMVAQDLRESCHAILFASVGGRKRRDRRAPGIRTIHWSHRQGAQPGEIDERVAELNVAAFAARLGA